jgi:hypothetical protein
MFGLRESDMWFGCLKHNQHLTRRLYAGVTDAATEKNGKGTRIKSYYGVIFAPAGKIPVKSAFHPDQELATRCVIASCNANNLAI